ncbi:MAG: GNAT family N-acetyltransferase [Phycisphaerae bacterium]|jgi:amino-acid N-acetyltransferase
MNITFKKATSGDLELIIGIVSGAGLPTYDITAAKLERFIIACEGEKPIGCAGFEISGKDALLRSLAVTEEARNNGLGKKLTGEIERICRGLGVREIYLLTKTAPKYFPSLGYRLITREETSEEIEKLTQFTDTSPHEATCMAKKL